jgi:phosphate transporter
MLCVFKVLTVRPFRYDKITESELKDKYMHERVETSYPFLQETKSRLNDIMSQLVMHYATCVAGGDSSAAANELKSYQREKVSKSLSDCILFLERGGVLIIHALDSVQIIWERDTVWRQMIGKERRGETDGRVKSLITVGGRQEPSRPLVTLSTPLGTLRINGKHISFLAAVTAFVAILKLPIVNGGEANRCLAILVFATILWATEVSRLCGANIYVLLLICLSSTTFRRSHCS